MTEFKSSGTLTGETWSGDLMNKGSSSKISSSLCTKDARASRRRKLELYRAKYAAGGGEKRRRVQMFSGGEREKEGETGEVRERKEISLVGEKERVVFDECPKFGHSSICGRRRDMEDFVAIHPSFCNKEMGDSKEFHYFGVYDGHGCSHVSKRCKERLHELVKEELDGKVALEPTEWKELMQRSFSRMDKEVITGKEAVVLATGCRCQLPSLESDAVGSTAVVAIVTPDKIVVANCGDSRAVLCRKGKAIPLSRDHKPDRPDELSRIEAAGGRVIYWDGPRVLGVLAMSRAIGDKYLKPYVSCEPEVTIINRTPDDECLILASDGLWDVVSNQTACGVARMCLAGKVPAPAHDSGSGEACVDASVLLTKLAFVRRSSDNVSVVVINLKKDT
ncbi:Protein-serine/threonine phosphatase [Heracleum sosnowskyi]|uniref:protein-serine/threonine phosphatase n=1 Tax=Heracleum sosnowskyi TaxID=360622 RepID=A0AAD8GXL4_9APIA|nr:Protein-serine/threonine phosphatase [Heracleum sosnowskyi]